jgi:hypothetical protein
MVTPISEIDARDALRKEQSEASNPEYFDAERRQRGWVFGWREDRGEPPMGTHTWIVADNGRVRMLGYTDTWDDAIDAELAR